MADRSVVTLTCPDGHSHTFKTKELCVGKRPVYRDADQHAGMDLVIVECPTCKKSWEDYVDCRRYN